jgi:hypothetical protein
MPYYASQNVKNKNKKGNNLLDYFHFLGQKNCQVLKKGILLGKNIHRVWTLILVWWPYKK